MNRVSRLLRIAVACAAAAPAAAQDIVKYFDSGALERNYAETIIWEICRSAPNECRVVGWQGRHVQIQGNDAAHESIARKLLELGASSGDIGVDHLLRVTLAAASRTGEGLEGDFTPDVRAALEDVATVLNYRAFRFLDASVLRTRSDGEVRLSGPGGQAFGLAVNLTGQVIDATATRIQVSQILLYPSTIVADEEGDAAGALIRSSLSIAIGETVVVGASKLNGGSEAVLLLVTALE